MDDFIKRILDTLSGIASPVGRVDASYAALAEATGENDRWRDAYEALGSLRAQGYLVSLERTAGSGGDGTFHAIISRRADGKDPRGRLLFLLEELRDESGVSQGTVSAIAEAMNESVSPRDVFDMVLALDREGAFEACQSMGTFRHDAPVRVRVW